MSIKYKDLQSILFEAFSKKILNNRINSDITHKIMMYYYKSEHNSKNNIKIELADIALSRESIRHADPIHACEHWWNCMCCKKHQINKAGIMDCGSGMIIITKTEVFDPEFKYWGNVPPSILWHGKEIVNRYYEYPGDNSCYCHCRQWTRDCARKYLEYKFGPEYKFSRREYALNIFGKNSIGFFENDENPPPGQIVEGPPLQPHLF